MFELDNMAATSSLQDSQQTEKLYKISRQIYSEKKLEKQFLTAGSEDNLKKVTLKQRLKGLFRGCQRRTLVTLINDLLPITNWLSSYRARQDGPSDLIGGLTVGIMHIPQGLAFGELASLPPVTGLYTSLIPVIVYMLFGTSRSLSMGAFPVVCMMIADVVNRDLPIQNNSVIYTNHNSSMNQTPGDPWDSLDARKVTIAVSLSFLIGITHAIMGLLRLGILARYLSDPVISGFTTGAAVVIITSQIIPILGISIPRYSGQFATVKAILSMIENISESCAGSVIIGLVCIAVLMTLKSLNERFRKNISYPVPAELLVVIFCTLISYGAKLNSRFDVEIVKEIPTGMPPTSIPSFSLMKNLIPDALKISIVIFATNISVAKLFAKKKNQAIDANQELLAYSLCNIGVSFFSGFPASIAIARVVVQANLARTQLCSLPVIALLLLVLLFIAPLFFHLPKAVLSAVVIANFLGILKQFSRIKVLWSICRSDAVVWCITCFGVIFLGIDVGLGLGVMVAAFLFILKASSQSTYSVLGNIPNTDLYKDIKQQCQAKEIPGVRIFRFESMLCYANVDNFRDYVLKQCVDARDYQTHNIAERNGKGSTSNKLELDPIICHKDQQDQEKAKPFVVHTLIFDAASFTYIDSMAYEAIKSIAEELQGSGIKLYFANCPRYLKTSLHRINQSLNEPIETFVSIHDAVLFGSTSFPRQATNDTRHQHPTPYEP